MNRAFRLRSEPSEQGLQYNPGQEDIASRNFWKQRESRGPQTLRSEAGDRPGSSLKGQGQDIGLRLGGPSTRLEDTVSGFGPTERSEKVDKLGNRVPVFNRRTKHCKEPAQAQPGASFQLVHVLYRNVYVPEINAIENAASISIQRIEWATRLQRFAQRREISSAAPNRLYDEFPNATGKLVVEQPPAHVPRPHNSLSSIVQAVKRMKETGNGLYFFNEEISNTSNLNLQYSWVPDTCTGVAMAPLYLKISGYGHSDDEGEAHRDGSGLQTAGDGQPNLSTRKSGYRARGNTSPGATDRKTTPISVPASGYQSRTEDGLGRDSGQTAIFGREVPSSEIEQRSNLALWWPVESQQACTKVRTMGLKLRVGCSTGEWAAAVIIDLKPPAFYLGQIRVTPGPPKLAKWGSVFSVRKFWVLRTSFDRQETLNLSRKTPNRETLAPG
ncbi:hypothetical protein B0H13DRAFT_1914771 [Mycena leptocephala]|nr:hypothetical protein B0H13DRAFT_1914771 [Mycena leptocephala]